MLKNPACIAGQKVLWVSSHRQLYSGVGGHCHKECRRLQRMCIAAHAIPKRYSTQIPLDRGAEGYSISQVIACPTPAGQMMMRMVRSARGQVLA